MSRVAIGRVEAYGAQCHLTQSDIVYIESLRSERRKSEVASWRELLRSTYSITADILYHPSGAPYIVDSSEFISVSHSSSHVAVILSEEPCSIDIESVSRNFEKVKSRFVTSYESNLSCEDAPLLPLLWSAKEALYKLSPLEGLDLLLDLRVLSIGFGELRATVKGCDGEILISYKLYDGDIIVHTA